MTAWSSDDLDIFETEQGFMKIKNACKVAQTLGFWHIWCDTICINKESSAELSEAINSMFAYYQSAGICIVYLEDYYTSIAPDTTNDFERARWFTRGWTLQELLAPSEMLFYDRTWNEIGTKESMEWHISRATGIHPRYLVHPGFIQQATVAQRMSWASRRETTRVEDQAYCLLGIFDINMPLLYGERAKAFIRLQEEIIRHNNDHTIFCWRSNWENDFKIVEISSDAETHWEGCLAPSAKVFRDGNRFQCRLSNFRAGKEFSLTNSGLRIQLPTLQCCVEDFSVSFLDASIERPGIVCVLTKKLGAVLARWWIFAWNQAIPSHAVCDIYLKHERSPAKWLDKSTRTSPIQITAAQEQTRPTERYAILPLYMSRRFSTVPLYSWSSLGMNKHILAGPILELQFEERSGLWTTSTVMKDESPDKMEQRHFARSGTWRFDVLIDIGDCSSAGAGAIRSAGRTSESRQIANTAQQWHALWRYYTLRKVQTQRSLFNWNFEAGTEWELSFEPDEISKRFMAQEHTARNKEHGWTKISAGGDFIARVGEDDEEVIVRPVIVPFSAIVDCS